MKNSILLVVCLLLAGAFLGSCSEEEISGTNFSTDPPERNEFDLWLLDNYVKEYNIDLKYHLDDIETDLSYNLIPADMEKSEKLARVIKYLWLESYDEVFDASGKNKNFMRKYAPKVILLVGSAAINPASSTEVMGTAESGIKVVLYKVNAVDPTDVDMLNEYYFKTMHHEFAHILHQTKNYPTEFNNLSSSDYSSTGWQNRTMEQAWKLGFVSNYASKQSEEDFVETIANYLVKPDTYWNNMLQVAGESGAAKINQKLEMAKDWLSTSWNIDIDLLKSIVAKRSKNIDAVLKGE